MNNCFDNIIGIRGECTDKIYDLYINELHGVTLDVAASVVEEDRSGVKLLQGIRDRAIKETLRNLKGKLGQYLNLHSDLLNKIYGTFNDEYLPVTCENVVAKIKRGKSCDPYQKVRIDFISVFPDRDVKKTLYIKDGDCITEMCVDLYKCKENIIHINHTLQSNEVEVYFKGCNVQFKEIKRCSCNNSGRSSCDCSFCFIDIEEGERFKIGASCFCDPSLIFCFLRNDESLQMAMLYKMGILLMYEVLTSGRDNPCIRNSKETAYLNLARWNGDKNPLTGESGEALYWKELAAVVKSAKHSLGKIKSKCITCNGVKKIIQLP